ncbi:2,3-bisphosphoglycerate-dependent phosphoglycerate mutase [Candidatus Woesearchaeota archaeon]|jgi:2,3-bisphosphoglycerate-dependent phosphoglycerate mutase|nr:2,3-bisphosphoglycerate-dependent phosphoglycerate mutase [Candidatus Woesearchaeota archaeon]|tara:strand:+ start:812 stop:1477 length:666 start_codon:yes stop_codon:yes gene_type:complete
MNSTLLVFRHAQSTDNQKKQFSGWRDPPLTAKGKKEALHTKKQLKDYTIDIGFESSQKRSAQTLRIVLGKRKIPVFVDDRIIERCYGVFQGQKHAKFIKANPHLVQKVRRGYATVPEFGESVKMVHGRTLNFLKQLLPLLRKYKMTVAISCHGNSMRPIRRHFERLSIKKEMKLENPQDRAMIYHVRTKGLPLPKIKWKSVRKPKNILYAANKKNPLRKYY